MARTSRILFPAGTRYVPIYEPFVKRFGFHAAAILGLLDFLDRAQELPMQPLASRARLIADLEGILGKGSVDVGLRRLLDASVVEKHSDTTWGKRNWETRVYYCLNTGALNAILGTTKIGGLRGCQERHAREVPISAPISDPEAEPKSAAASSVKKEKEGAAAWHALDAASTRSQVSLPAKIRERRPSGIVTWIQDDVANALQLEAAYAADTIQVAVGSLERSGKQPVPGLVLQEIERIQAESQRKAQLVAEQAVVEAEQRRKEAISKERLLNARRLLQQLSEQQLNELATFIVSRPWEAAISRHRHGASSKVLRRDVPLGIERQILFRALDALGLVPVLEGES
jgi:hypothetical protein